MNSAITVSKFNNYIKQIFDAEELLHNIEIIGEVFGVSSSRNVIYFYLKDEEASLPCVCFYPNLASEIIEGNRVVVTGSPNFYTKAGKLNFNVVRVEKAGQGLLYEQFLLMKQKLEQEGLFSEKHKKQIPSDIKRIGVITSREGAVLQDIKNVAWRRNPGVDIVLFNTKVQGNNAENEIAHAIDVMGKYDNIDVLIVARGGGSLEDLAAYNTEIVARATYNCPKPIVSAVGHETDYTIIDFVSDLRAPTPSAAAELLTYNKLEKKIELTSVIEKLKNSFENYLKYKSVLLGNVNTTLQNNIEKILINNFHELNASKNRFLNCSQNFLNQKIYELGIIENTLVKSNPEEILKKGFVKVEQQNKNINSANKVDFNENMYIIFKDGTIEAKPLNKGEKV